MKRIKILVVITSIILSSIFLFIYFDLNENPDQNNVNLTNLNKNHINALGENYSSEYSENVLFKGTETIQTIEYYHNEDYLLLNASSDNFSVRLFFDREFGMEKIENYTRRVDSETANRAQIESKGILNQIIKNETRFNIPSNLQKKNIEKLENNNYIINYNKGNLELKINEEGVIEEQTFHGRYKKNGSEIIVTVQYEVTKEEGINLSRPDWFFGQTATSR